ncbi:MAG: hypothetical protein M1831_006629 [Alyxoria varia]|nr:MAG: hypothetical protein M1831_006629 [Alyxoria varia]
MPEPLPPSNMKELSLPRGLTYPSPSTENVSLRTEDGPQTDLPDTTDWSTNGIALSELRISTPSSIAESQSSESFGQSVVDETHTLSISENDTVSEPWFSRFVPTKGGRACECFEWAGTLPPVTVDKLKELDFTKILNNARLQHDLNFDHNLRFRPNLEGPNGDKKRKQARRYWIALQYELEVLRFLHDSEPAGRFKHTELWRKAFKSHGRRLPILLECIKDVVLRLVTWEDQHQMEEMLDVPFLMQQVERDVLDLPSLIRCLAERLKAHCAPTRDASIDGLVRSMESSVNSDLGAFVKCVERFVDLLETMTLDVANFQIYTNKAVLLSASCASSQAYFAFRLNTGAPGRISVDAARTWFQRSAGIDLRWSYHYKPEKSYLNSLGAAIVNTLVPSNIAEEQTFPECFKFDFARLQALRTHIKNLIHTQVCVLALHKTMLQCRRPPSRKILAESTKWLVDVLPCIIGGDSASEAAWHARLGHIIAELAYIAPCDTDDRLPQHARIDSAPPAAQNDDFTSTCSRVEKYLCQAFIPGSSVFDSAATTIRDVLTHRVHALLSNCANLPPVQLRDELLDPYTGSRQSPRVRGLRSHNTAGIDRCGLVDADKNDGESCWVMDNRVEETARRVAHVAIVHWRVFGCLVYLLHPTPHFYEHKHEKEEPIR